MARLETPTLNKGRGSSFNPDNRFERLALDREETWDLSEDKPIRTEFFRDLSQSIISYNNSPDIPFRASLNPYRGCEHGCAYCYARPTHEYLGFSAGLDFESRIMVKEDAPELLRAELSSSKWKPQWLALSGVTDAYQPIEKKLEITRRCIEVLVEFRNPVGIVTKNRLVTRDLDLLGELARFNAASVYISLTTLKPERQRAMEPRTSSPRARLETIQRLRDAGVPVGVMIGPLIPGFTDEEVPSILEAAAGAGAQFAAYIMLRLPLVVRPLFEDWLDREIPDRKEKVLNRLREMRDGKLNSSEFGERMRGKGHYADQVNKLFKVSLKKFGYSTEMPKLSTRHFRRPGGTQLKFHIA